MIATTEDKQLLYCGFYLWALTYNPVWAVWSGHRWVNS